METTQDIVLQLIRENNGKLDKVLSQQIEIIIQTTRTNGRVNAIEEWKEGIDESHAKVQTDVGKLRDYVNTNKGRDNVIYLILLCFAAVLGFVINHMLQSPIVSAMTKK